MPHTKNLGEPLGPCPPLPPAASAEAALPAPPAALPAPRDPLPPPRLAPAPPPPRTHPAHTPRRGRAACGQRREARGRESRRGRREAESKGASPERPPRPGRSLTYLRRISLPPWGSTWPGRARPRGRGGGPATARRGRPRARLWRTARRGGGSQAAQGSGRRIPHRPSGMPPPPRPDRQVPRAPQQTRSARARVCHLSVPAVLTPPLVPHSSAARLPAPPRFGSPQRARRTPAHAPLPGARGLALPGLAPPEPAREPTCRHCRAAAEGNPREAIEWPRRGQDWLLDPRPRAAASAGGGGAGQVGGPRTPWASASSASCQARRDPCEIRRSETGEQGKEGRIQF